MFYSYLTDFDTVVGDNCQDKFLQVVPGKRKYIGETGTQHKRVCNDKQYKLNSALKILL